MAKPGPTGEFPRGKLREDDEGGLNVVASIDRPKNTIILDFTKPISWLALGPEDAMRVATQLAQMALHLDPALLERYPGPRVPRRAD